LPNELSGTRTSWKGFVRDFAFRTIRPTLAFGAGMAKPMGVAEFQLLRALPEPLDTSLPTVE
jgi:hypothetical protein